MSEKPSRPKDALIEEWFGAEVTRYYFEQIMALRANADAELAAQGFDEDSPYKLMARRANLWGMRNALDALCEVYESKSLGSVEESHE